MIILDSLTMENFGSYKKKQMLDFGGHTGVLVAHAENGVGKTTIIDAFRWVFTGKIGGKDATKGPETRLNIPARLKASREGSKVTMKVTASLLVDGVPVEVTRELTRKADGNISLSLSLKEDGAVLGQAAAPDRLNEILPSEIQQFFFFDGELISEFEKMLSSPASKIATPLVTSIEGALGIPTLKKTSDVLGRIEEATMREVTRGETASRHNRELARTVGTLRKQEGNAQKSLSNTENSLKDSVEKLAQLEAKLSGTDSAMDIMSRRDREEGGLEQLLLIEKETLSDLQLSAADGWKTLLIKPLTLKITEITKQAKKLEKTLTRTRRDNLLITLQQEAAHSGKCPCCGNIYKDDEPSGQSSDELAIEGDLKELKNTLEVLTSIDCNAASKNLTDAINANYKSRNAVSDSKNKIEDLKKALTGVDEESIQDLLKEHANQSILKDKAEVLIGESQEALLELRNNIEKLVRQFTDEEDEVVASLLEKTGLVQDLSTFFSEAAERYRNDQRKKVEAAATKRFLSISHQEEYVGLSINENYGLTIIHENGQTEDLIAAGYEHIVALSLIGALQETSLVKGPVVMDTPFGRLDPRHRKSVLKSLPKMAPQVVLLVHPGEATPEDVLENIDASEIIAQIRLVEHSAHEATMELIGGKE